MSLRLRLRTEAASSGIVLDGAAITPDRLGGSSPLAAARLAVSTAPVPGATTGPASARRGAPALGDLFAIDDDGGRAPDTITLEGDVRDVARLGAGMNRGRLHVHGDAGPRAGSLMSGGRLEIDGDAGARTGEGMTGGVLVVGGSAGDHLGAPVAGGARGIDGGVIVVRGAAGAMAAFRMRRGTVFIGGATGPAAGAALLAGTLVLARAPGPGAAALMRRGTIVVLEPSVPGATFAAAGRAPAPWLAPWWNALDVAGVPLPAGLACARFARYSGDLAEGGRGEILILEGDS